MIITNAKDQLLTANTGTLPDMGGTLDGYYQPMSFSVLTKTLVNFAVVETSISVACRGCIQPFKPEQLQMRPEAQRSWNWFMIHAEPGLLLKTDDVITFQTVQYRVMEKVDFSLYGYVQYNCVRDYQ